MRLARWNTIAGSCFLAALLSLPAWSATTDRHSATPGTLNYVEGQASIGDQKLDSKSVSSVELQAGENLTTQNGKAEILLTPGVYLRLGSNSSVQMVSPNLTTTQLALQQGEAMVEVDEIHSQNDIRITQNGANTRLLKTGLYDFDAANSQVRVFDGKARVLAGDRAVTVKGGHELALNDVGKMKAQGFDKKQVAQSDDLYRWSSLRSDYLSEANVDTARGYFANGGYGPGWFGPGWYWDPWFGAFTFVPADGFLFSPFGWGFFSPPVVQQVPVAVVRGPHRFDGTQRAPAIGTGFHEHAVRSFHGSTAGMSGMRSGTHAMSAPPPPARMGGFRGSSMNPPPMR